MDEDKPVGAFDAIILRHCDSKSPAEISEMFNGAITPKGVAKRVQELIENPNWLTQAQQEEIILRRMRELVAKIEEQSKEYRSVEMYEAHIRALEAVAKRVDKRRETNAVDLNSLYGNQAAIMLRALDLATGYLRGAFREQIDQEKWDEAIREGMSLARKEVEKHKAIE